MSFGYGTTNISGKDPQHYDSGAAFGVLVVFGIVALFANLFHVNFVLLMIVVCLFLFAIEGVCALYKNLPHDFDSTIDNLPRLWDHFAHLLPFETKTRVFSPSREKLLERYLLARRSYRTKAARRWLSFAFTMRAVHLVLQCLCVMVGEKARIAIVRITIKLFGDQAIEAFKAIMFIFFPKF